MTQYGYKVQNEGGRGFLRKGFTKILVCEVKKSWRCTQMLIILNFNSKFWKYKKQFLILYHERRGFAIQNINETIINQNTV